MYMYIYIYIYVCVFVCVCVCVLQQRQKVCLMNFRILKFYHVCEFYIVTKIVHTSK